MRYNLDAPPGKARDAMTVRRRIVALLLLLGSLTVAAAVTATGAQATDGTIIVED
jgi:hypothetical protein